MIVGIGADVCSVDRFLAAEARPGVAARVLADAEREGSVQTRAGRFAAKEALAKALGAPAGLSWLDCRVVRAPSGQPSFELSGTVRARAEALGVRTVHLSISHDAGVALAVVVCEG